MTSSDPVTGDLPIESLRRLARGLVLDRGSADDVVQEAWLAALETRGEIRGMGAWLAGAVRRLARNRVRGDVRREHRERVAARTEAQPSAVDASARIEILQRLLAAVERLPSPYREAIVLRYFDDLPPRAIAQRLGVPVNTARTHVRRGLERLRGELDPGPGREREALLAALVPFLGPIAGSGVARDPIPASTRTSLVQNPVLLATSALVLGTLTWFVVRPTTPGPIPGGPSIALGKETFGVALPEPVASPAASPEPGTQGQTASAQGSRSAAASAWTVRGRVSGGGWDPFPDARLVGRVFAGGRPEGVPLSEEHFQADGQGFFAWAPATPEGVFTLEVRADQPGVLARPATLWCVSGDQAPENWWLYFYPLDTTLRGNVRGADGQPLAEAWVAISLGDEARAVRSGADGSFALPCASGRMPRSVCAWKTGLAPGLAELAKPLLGSEQLYEITLQPELRMHGTVRGADGAPIAGAEVTVTDQTVPATISQASPSSEVVVRRSSGPLLSGAWPSTRTDPSGRYEITGIHPQASAVVLRASAPGHRPAEVSCPGPAMSTERNRDFALARGVTVTGSVLAGGRASEAAWVTVGDWTGEAGAPQAWCDAEGRFTLAGVAPGPQHLWVWRRGFAQLRHDVDVREGMPTLELELPASHFVAGLVLGPDGAPAPWASLIVEDATGAEPPSLSGYGTRAAADGRFRIADLPACRVALSVSAQGCEVLTQEVALDRDDLVLRLAAEVEASVPAPVIPVAAASGRASLHGRLLDLAGNALASEEIELVAAPAAGASDSGIMLRSDSKGEFRPVTTAAPGRAARPWRTTTDARGEFRITGLPAGTFDAHWVRKEAGLTALDLETRVTLAADEARELELQPRGRSTLRGAIEFLTQPPANTVTAGYGKLPVLGPPPEGMPAVAAFGLRRSGDDGSSLPELRGGFAHDGAFVIEGLTAGEWLFEPLLTLPGGRRASIPLASVTVPERGTTEFRLGVLYYH